MVMSWGRDGDGDYGGDGGDSDVMMTMIVVLIVK